jgi:hypothetical protein
MPVVDSLGFPVLDTLWYERRDSAALPVLPPDSGGAVEVPDPGRAAAGGSGGEGLSPLARLDYLLRR